MDLMIRDDIEKAGFTFEPDSTKCKLTKIKMHFDCNYYKDGEWTGRNTPTIDEEWKNRCAEIIKITYPHWSSIHQVFVPEVEPLSGQGVMCRWVMIRGHP